MRRKEREEGIWIGVLASGAFANVVCLFLNLGEWLAFANLIGAALPMVAIWMIQEIE